MADSSTTCTGSEDSILILQDLYNEALTRELIEHTKSRGLPWQYVGANTFRATFTADEGTANQIEWTYTTTKTQIGVLAYKYSLTVLRNGVAYVTTQDGPLSYNCRDSVVKDLYEVAEILTLQLDARLRETLSAVQTIQPTTTSS